MLRGLLVVGLDLHAVVRPEELRILAVPQEVLIVHLQVPQSQPVLLRSHALELERGSGGLD